MVLQFGEHEVSMAAISDKVRQSWKENGNEGELREIKIYVKPEDNKAYYVINKEIAGGIEGLLYLKTAQIAGNRMGFPALLSGCGYTGLFRISSWRAVFRRFQDRSYF